MTNLATRTNSMVLNHEWATRPDDQRFVSLDLLAEAVRKRKDESWTATPAVNQLRCLPVEAAGGKTTLGVEVYDPTFGAKRILGPTHHGFGQLAQYAKAPASYLRTLPPEIAAINVQWGLERNPMRPETLLLAQSNGHNSLRSMTSTSYGRIWDREVVHAVQKMNQNSDGRWVVPSSTYTTKNPLRATTLYASDQDVFVFLVDPKNPVEIPGDKEPMYRGFYTWNSEVGAGVFGICTFLYRYICDNRIIWGQTDVQELRIRHTGGAPERFAYEGAKYLAKYAEESTAGVVAGVVKAKAAMLPEKEENGVTDWLKSRGFTATQAKASVDAAVAEEGQVRSVWDIVNGITAHARSIPFTDQRVELEAKAGKLMAEVNK